MTNKLILCNNDYLLIVFKFFQQHQLNLNLEEEQFYDLKLFIFWLPVNTFWKNNTGTN